MINPCHGNTKPDAGVIVPRPATAPEIIPTAPEARHEEPSPNRVFGAGAKIDRTRTTLPDRERAARERMARWVGAAFDFEESALAPRTTCGMPEFWAKAGAERAADRETVTVRPIRMLRIDVPAVADLPQALRIRD
mgnify:CR=1 FL=1